MTITSSISTSDRVAGYMVNKHINGTRICATIVHTAKRCIDAERGSPPIAYPSAASHACVSILEGQPARRSVVSAAQEYAKAGMVSTFICAAGAQVRAYPGTTSLDLVSATSRFKFERHSRHVTCSVVLRDCDLIVIKFVANSAGLVCPYRKLSVLGVKRPYAHSLGSIFCTVKQTLRT